MVNDLLSDPCAYGQRKKVLMLAYSPPNESPILRILGMNNRNKITFKMLHLTVDVLEAAVAAELPTAHISHLQQARWSHTGGPWSFYCKRLDSPSQIWISTLLGLIHACAPAVRRPGCTAKTHRKCVSSNSGRMQ